MAGFLKNGRNDAVVATGTGGCKPCAAREDAPAFEIQTMTSLTTRDEVASVGSVKTDWIICR